MNNIQINVAEMSLELLGLTTEIRGAYLSLILHYFMTEKPIPENKIAAVIGSTQDRFIEIKEQLAKLFLINDMGAWIHEDTQYKITKIKEIAKRGNEVRWGESRRSPTNPPRIPHESPTIKIAEEKELLAQVENQEENIKKRNKTAYSEAFEEFWKVYSHPEGKQQTFKEYKAIINSGESTHDELVSQARSYKQYLESCTWNRRQKAAFRWLHDRTWQSDYAALRDAEISKRSAPSAREQSAIEMLQFIKRHDSN